MEMLIRTQSAKVGIAALGILMNVLFWNTQASATSSVSIIQKNGRLNSITASVGTDGWMTAIEDQLSVSTTNTTGYSLYISTNTETNNLVSGDGAVITPTSSSTASPAALSRDSWGFAVPSSNIHSVVDGFSADYSSFVVPGGTKPSGLWAAVPVKSEMALIQKTESEGTYDLDVFYGFNLSRGVRAGTYTGTILYTAVANADEGYDIGSFSINPYISDSLSGGTLISLEASISPEVDIDDIGIVYVKIGGQNCEGASGSITDGMLRITCTAPPLSVGTYDVGIALIDLDGSEHSVENGYTVALDYESSDISINPTRIIIDKPGQLRIDTDIKTSDLEENDLEVYIGEYQCAIEEVIYNSGSLSVLCSYPSIMEPGQLELSLLVKSYQTTFTGELVVDQTAVLTELTYMQDMTAAICHNTPTPSSDATGTIGIYDPESDKIPTATLTDTRDGKQYQVSKLADGNCWMTQNLRLGSDEAITLSSFDSDITETYTLPAVQTSGNSGWNNDLPHIYDTGSDETGAIYNWLAATAGSGANEEYTSDIHNSICPKGWTLPSMGAEDSFTSLLAAYGWNNKSQAVDTLTQSPFNFVFSGGYYYGYGGTANGEYWTATALPSSTTHALYLKLESTSRRVYTDTSKPRSGGSAIRCVATGTITE